MKTTLKGNGCAIVTFANCGQKSHVELKIDGSKQGNEGKAGKGETKTVEFSFDDGHEFKFEEHEGMIKFISFEEFKCFSKYSVNQAISIVVHYLMRFELN